MGRSQLHTYMDAVDRSEAPKVVVQRILKHTTSEETLLAGEKRCNQLARLCSLSVVRLGCIRAYIMEYLDQSGHVLWERWLFHLYSVVAWCGWMSPCNFLHEGLSQLLRAVGRGGTAGSEVLRCYLEESSECKEILRYLQWERQKQSGDGVRCMHRRQYVV